MQRWKSAWPWGLALLALVTVAIGLLHSDPLSEVGHPVPPSLPEQGGQLLRLPSLPAPALPGAEIDAVIAGVLVWVLLPLAVVLYAIALFTSRRARRHATALALVVLLATIVAIAVGARREATLPAGPAQEAEGFPVEAAPGPSTPDQAPRAPDWVVWLVAVLLALACLAGAYLAWRHFRPRPARPLVLLAEQAQASLEELRAGGDLRDVVTRCYAEMSRIVGERRGLHRRASMTPREFARRLEQSGLPAGAVHRLTLLFERVRYADQPPGQTEEQEAKACLQAILTTVGES